MGRGQEAGHQLIDAALAHRFERRLDGQAVEAVVGPFLDEIDQLGGGGVRPPPAFEAGDPGPDGAHVRFGLVAQRGTHEVAQDLHLVAQARLGQGPAGEPDQQVGRDRDERRGHRTKPGHPGRDRAGQDHQPDAGRQEEGQPAEELRPRLGIAAVQIAAEPDEQAGRDCQPGQAGRALEQGQEHRSKVRTIDASPRGTVASRPMSLRVGRPPGRDAAWALLCAWTQTEALRRHGLAVEATVRWYGERRFGIVGPELETWAAAGLLHDFDYERYPSTHPIEGAEELRRLGYPAELVEAVLGHGDHTGVARTSLLARTVYACDEMSGFVIAVAYVRPNRSLDEVDARAVGKKLRDKGFARQVPRDQLLKGAAELGVPFEEHVANVVEGLKTVRGELRL